MTVRDTTAPVLSLPAGQVFEATSGAGAVVVFVGATASDAVSAVTLEYSQASGTLFGLGTTTVSVIATDAAGNASRGSFTVTVRDTTAPVGTVLINGGATTTANRVASLAISFADVVGVTEMRFSLDDGATWSDWGPYATAKTVILALPDGPKSVYVQARDAAGNVGGARSQIILLDQTAPAITSITVGPTTICGLCTPLLFSYTATDVSGIAFAAAYVDGRAIQNNGLIDGFLLAAGAHTLTIELRDALGNAATTSITFYVRATIEDLICAVQRATREGLIERQLENSLLVKLYAARKSRDRGHVWTEINQLTAFTHELAAQRGKKITTSFADRARGWTADLIARLQSG